MEKSPGINIQDRGCGKVSVEVFNEKNSVRILMGKDNGGGLVASCQKANLTASLRIVLWGNPSSVLFNGFYSNLCVIKLDMIPQKLSIFRSSLTCNSDFSKLMRYILWYSGLVTVIDKCYIEDLPIKSAEKMLRKIPEQFFPTIIPELIKKISAKKAKESLKKIPCTIEGLLLGKKHDVIAELDSFPEGLTVNMDILEGVVYDHRMIDSIIHILSSGVSLNGSCDVNGTVIDFNSMSIEEEMNFFTVHKVYME